MKLYYSKDACSLTVRILLHELGLSAEYESVDLTSKKTASGADYKTINPRGNVPALVLDDGTMFVENLVIQFYLAEKYPHSKLIPATPSAARYCTIEWLSFIATDLHKSFVPFFVPNVPEEAKAGIFTTILRGKFSTINDRLANNRYLSGDDFTGADIYLFVVTRWLPATPLSLQEWPHLKRFMDEMNQRPAVKKALAEEAQ
jgi:glutathione S-transferase